MYKVQQVFLFVYCVLFSFAAFASPSQSKWCVEGALGSNIINNRFKGNNGQNQDTSNDYSLKRQKTLALSVGVNKKIKPNYELGVSVYNLVRSKATGRYWVDNSIKATDKYSTLSILLKGRYYFDFFEEKKLKPYISAGAGVSWNRAKATHVFDGVSEAYTSQRTLSSFAYQLGIGVNYQYTNNLGYFSEFLYQDLGKAAPGNKTTNSFGQVGTVEQKKYHIRQGLLLVGMKYLF